MPSVEHPTYSNEPSIRWCWGLLTWNPKEGFTTHYMWWKEREHAEDYANWLSQYEGTTTWVIRVTASHTNGERTTWRPRG